MPRTSKKKGRQQTVPNRRARLRRILITVSEREPGDYEVRIGGSATLSKMFETILERGMKLVTGIPDNPAWKPMEPIAPDNNNLVDYGDSTADHFVNDLYMVERNEVPGGLTHLSIKRNDKTRVREWRHLQQIKNELAGPHRFAVEIFPPEQFLVDQADQYHLWVLPEGADISFAWHERRVEGPENAEEMGKENNVVIDQSPWVEGLTTGQTPDALEGS